MAFPSLAHAVPRPIVELYATGVDDRGALLGDGIRDPHWTVVSSTDLANPGPDLFALPSAAFPLDESWTANTLTGRWLALRPADPSTAPNSVFVIERRIDLAGYLPNTAVVSFDVAADDDYAVALNGIATGIVRPNASFTLVPHALSIGWQAGGNSIRFSINSVLGGPTGFFVSTLTGTAEPDVADSDADLLSNYIERLGGTDPTKADSDGDGLRDGIEDANRNGVVDAGETNPRVADTDADGILDGAEDRNKNGVVDAGESDPRRADSDADGIADGVEDKNRNGLRDAGETDPSKEDTDADGLPDGVEDNNKSGARDAGETDPLNADTDGDTLKDGEEDKNKSGVREMGETDPLNADTDGGGVGDGVEVRGGNNPLDPADDSKLKDADGDGLADSVEVSIGTDPLKKDTDGDGLGDGLEVGVDVKRAKDSDGDGRIDALDDDDDSDGILTKEEGAGDGKNQRDTDADGVADFLDADDDGDGIPTRQEVDDGAKRMPKSPDVDGDGKFNWLDTDSDGDGILDGTEALDSNGDSVPDYLQAAAGGCKADADCSGGVCNATTGVCTPGAVNTPVVAAGDAVDGELQGGGLSCVINARPANGALASLGLLALGFLATLSRRARRTR